MNNKLSFKNFFLERKYWAKNTLLANDIADKILQSIQSGKLNLINNNMVVDLDINQVEILLKSFFNYKGESAANAQYFQKGYKFKSGKKTKLPLIEIYFFEMFSDLRNYRGRSINDLNSILQKFTNINRSKIKATLSHELQHAIDDENAYYGSKSGYKAKSDDPTEKYKAYMNDVDEVTARIIEFLTPLNEKWEKQLKAGKWIAMNSTGHLSDDVITGNITKRIVKDADITQWLIPKLRKKFIKGIYSTVQYLWKHYKNAARKKERANKVSEKDLLAFLKSV